MTRRLLVCLCLLPGCFENSDSVDSGAADETGTGDTSSGGDTSSADDGDSSGPPDTSGADDDTDATSDAGAMTGDEGSSSSDGPTECEGITTETAMLVADSGLILDTGAGCPGSIHHGGDAFVNIGLGVGLVRFQVSPEVASAITEDRVESMTLTLHRAPDCGGSCPATAGSLSARPLRNDWVEGVKDVDYGGADWCRRTQGNPGDPWGMPGANDSRSDRGMQSGVAMMDDSQPSVDLALDPALHAEWATPNMDGAEVSVRIEAVDGVFVAVAKEDTNAADLPAELAITYCP